MATLAIGDIHGEYRVLRKLLAENRLGATDRMVLVGDLIGRGKSGHDVLRWAADQGDKIQIVLGNHDLHLLGTYYLQLPINDPAKRSILEAYDAAELCAWLRRRPLALALAHCNALVVHAGPWHSWDLPATLCAAQEFGDAIAAEDPKPALQSMYGNSQDRWDERLAGEARLQAIANILTRMRTCRADGSINMSYRGLPNEAYGAGNMTWFDYPDRKLRSMLIVCGHWSALGLTMRSDIAMIDTGCCYGGPLTGLWIEDRRLVTAN